MGISNDLFPATRNENQNCNMAYGPFDVPRTEDLSYNNPLKIMPAWLMFTEFMRFVDAPRPGPMSGTAEGGKELFEEIGCSLCHNPAFQTQGTALSAGHFDQIGAQTVALRGQTVNLYSDLLIHHMGATLADNIVQGETGPDEFRTTPLWGLGQRLYFLHDGRTSDLMVAIVALDLIRIRRESRWTCSASVLCQKLMPCLIHMGTATVQTHLPPACADASASCRGEQRFDSPGFQHLVTRSRQVTSVGTEAHLCAKPELFTAHVKEALKI